MQIKYMQYLQKEIFPPCEKRLDHPLNSYLNYLLILVSSLPDHVARDTTAVHKRFSSTRARLHRSAKTVQIEES